MCDSQYLLGLLSVSSLAFVRGNESSVLVVGGGVRGERAGTHNDRATIRVSVPLRLSRWASLRRRVGSRVRLCQFNAARFGGINVT